MNKTYRSVWNAVTNTWTAAAETAKSHSKGSARAARQAVVAIALGGAAIGSAAAAEACTTEDGSSGTVDAAGVCTVASSGVIGTMGSVGTMAALDDALIKVNGTAASTATASGAIAIGSNASADATGAAYQAVAIGANASASGNALAVGASSHATTRGVAIGGAANAKGNRATAIGYITTASGDNTVAIGSQANAQGTNSIAIGPSALASADNATTLGVSASAGGTGSTVIGQGALVVSGADNSVALGINARVANSNSAAVGSNSSAAGNYSSAFGPSATSTGTSTIALGGNSTATGNYSIAIGGATGSGRGAVAAGANSIAIGTTATTSANNAVALGYGTVADRAGTVSVGAAVANMDGNTFTRQIVNVAAGTEANDAVNLGQMNTALSTKVDNTYVNVQGTGAAASVGSVYGIAIGSGAVAGTGGAETAVGNAASAQGLSATAIGSSAIASGDGAAALGRLASASGSHATALGNQATAGANSAIAIGDRANVGALATNSVAIGTQAMVAANVTGAVAIGSGSSATRNNTISVGSATQQRQITNVAAGTADTDAVNVAQMNAGLSTTNASIAATNLTVSSLSTGLSTTSSTVASLSTGLSSTNSTVAGLSTGLSSTSSTVAGLSTGLSSTNSTVAGLSTGLSSTSSTVAGLSTSLSTTSSTVAGLSTGLSTTNSTVAGLSTGLSTTNSTVAGLSTGLSSTNSTVAGHTKQIGDLDDKLSKLESGTTGLVQQANAGDDITVGANTDGAAVNFAGTAGNRTLKGVAAGAVSATSNEAVNGSQLHGVADSVASAIGGGSAVNPDGSISAPAFTVGDGSGSTKIVNSVGDVVTNLDGRVTTNEGAISKLADEIGSGTLGLVQQTNAGDDITVGANTDGAAVNFAGTAGDRTLKGVAAGAVSATSNEAVNGAQLHGVADSVASAIGGGSAVNPDGSISAPAFTVGDGSGGTKIVNSVGDVVTNLDGRVTTNEGAISKLADEIGSGTLGLVQQANAGDDITVGANTDGAAVNFAGTAGNRTLKGVAAGAVSATSNEAVNGSQLHGVANSVASAIGGGSAVNPDGSISAPAFTVGDGSGGTKIVNSVGDAVTNINGRVTTNETNIAKNTGDITNINNQLGELSGGTIGLVRQAGAGADLTVGANTDGATVNFAGTAGARKLTGLANGTVAAGSTDAVTGDQLHTVVADVGSLDGRVTSNETSITQIRNDMSSGSIGLVRQDPTSGAITVAAASGGTSVNFAGTGGARTLSGVANGVNNDDAVTIAQLKATGLIDYTGKEVGAVTYDDGIELDSVTFGGKAGTTLHNIAPGLIAAGSMDGVNGGQLYAMQQEFAKQYGDLNNKVGDLSGRIGELEAGAGGPGDGGGTPGYGPGTGTGGEGSLVVGGGADASGSNGTAVGQGSVASGSNGTSLGQGSAASGSNGTAIGQGAVASGENSTALGQGASATASGSVAIGQGSVATEANTVSFGDGTAEGNRRLVNIADGVNASDAATKGQLDRAMESVDARFNDTNRAINDVAKNAYAGIAAAMAMPNMTPSQPGKTVVAVGAANFKSGSAIAAGATYRSRSGNWLVNGATSITSVGDVGVRAQVGYEF
ncbi:hypothetical protein WS90_09755 [Burkholderia cepacia]|uniref:Adhesin n=1 Tax=Burkholderia cepacia TaxID=292 RepID=A0A103ZS93_BURCE|nr:ESPR-type extended signal peptide-containing protein [Burkholderia cepacia]KVK85181.1 hypothetical protein WS90_09755 [Burkholderia cepacia]